MESIRRQYQQIIEENFEENYQAALKTKDYLEHSSVAYHGRCVRTLQIPKVFTPEVAEKYGEIVTVTYGYLKR